ncbi:MAG: phage portal protein [Planctomycetaceae bacterium]
MLRFILLTAQIITTGCAGAFLDTPRIETASATRFGYDAVEHRKRRRSTPIESRREDEILNQSQRGQLRSSAGDLRRNSALAAWLVRKHLDFVSRFRFQSRHKTDKGWNREYEAAVAEWSKKGNVEASRRWRLSKMLRMVEAHRTLDGDHGLLKLASGRLQMIESDRIRDARGQSQAERWVQGVKLGPADEHLAYAIHRRKIGGGYEFERDVPAANFILHGYFDRADQTRGISPLAAGLNSLRDVYENFEYALARSKIEQMMGYVFTTTADDDGSTGFGVHTAQAAGENDNEQEAAGDKYDVDFGRAPWKVELNPGDNLQTLQSTNPSSQFQTFHQAVVMVVLKSLDLPYSFFDEAHTNFHGSLRAAQLYMRSARDRIEDNQELLTQWLQWRTAIAIQQEGLTLPKGETATSLATSWVPDGVPWWDKLKEVKGDRLAVASAFDNPQRICSERGTDYFDNVDRIAEAIDYSKEVLGPRGFELSFAGDGATLVDPSQLATDVAEELQNAR